MILKKEKKEKKNYKINKFLFIYFIFTIILGLVSAIFIFIASITGSLLALEPISVIYY